MGSVWRQAFRSTKLVNLILKDTLCPLIVILHFQCIAWLYDFIFSILLLLLSFDFETGHHGGHGGC